MGQFLRGSVSTGAKDGGSSTGRVCAAGFYHVAARSHLARVLKLMNRLFIYFSNFLRAAVNSEYGGTTNTNSARTPERTKPITIIIIIIIINATLGNNR
jgi:hypothetical protein